MCVLSFAPEEHEQQEVRNRTLESSRLMWTLLWVDWSTVRPALVLLSEVNKDLVRLCTDGLRPHWLDAEEQRKMRQQQASSRSPICRKRLRLQLPEFHHCC